MNGFVLTAYSLPYTMGYIALQNGQPNPAPLSVLALMDDAAQWGLAGVEIPLHSRIPSFDGAIVETASIAGDIGAELRARDLKLVADYGALLDYDAQHTKDYLDLAARCGAKVVRAILSHLLCGDRRQMPGGWNAHRDAIAIRLRELLPYVEERGLVLALENHQDAATEDFWRLYEQTGQSPAFGVTLDTGNPLAVGQDPVQAARDLAPLIRHIHCKDYTLHFAPDGYRLVRCAAGEGVIDFPAILAVISANGHAVLPGIEIAAQATRTVPLLEADWWACYPARQTEELLPVLRLLWAQGKPLDAPYSSAWERGGSSDVVRQEEREVLERSIGYFRAAVNFPERLRGGA